jgi:hypothetical protein
MNEQDKLLIFFEIKKNSIFKFVKLGEVIYNLIPKYTHIYQVYRELKIKEFQGEKALSCYIAFKMGKDTGVLK